MQPIVTDQKYHRWADSIMSPGVVGSVGDTLVTPFLKTSTIDLPRRVESQFAGNNAPHSGANISDGDLKAYTSHGLGARTVDSKWNGNRSFRDVKGWVFQDLRAPDKMVEPFVSSLGDYSWRNKVAKVEEQFRTGSYFSKLPGEYSSNGIPRGGQMPRQVYYQMDDTPYAQNSFLPVLDTQAAKEPEEPPKQAVMTPLQTMAANAAESMTKSMQPLTSEDVKEWQDNSPAKFFPHGTFP